MQKRRITIFICDVFEQIFIIIMILSSLRTSYFFSSLKLVILRHGQSSCNQKKVWSGWSEAKLTPKGQADAAECANILKEQGLTFDTAYCSFLERSSKTLDIILQKMNLRNIPVKRRWQLNQKFYGALQQLEKMPVVHKYGQQIVGEWRRSYKIAPPIVFPEDHRHPINDQKYKDIDPSLLPNTQHLGHVLHRVHSLYKTQIIKDLEENKKVLIVCHGSVTRVFTNILFNFSYRQSSKFNIPNATPLIIELSKELKMQSWNILGDESKIAKMMKKIQNQLKE